MNDRRTVTGNQRVLIGVGGAGINIAKIMIEQSFNCARHLYVGSPEWLQDLPDDERIFFGFDNDDEPHSVREVRDKLRRSQRAIISGKLKGMDTVVITVGLGGMTGGYSAMVISDMASELEIPAVVLATMPFGFESKERKMNAEGQLHLLRANTRLMMISNDIIPVLSPQGENLSDAFDSMNIGLAALMNALTLIRSKTG